MSAMERGHAWVTLAVMAGVLPADADCEACGESQNRHRYADGSFGQRRIRYHHFDYDKPQDVIPLCVKCHNKVHAGRIPEPRTGRMYEPSGEGGMGHAANWTKPIAHPRVRRIVKTTTALRAPKCDVTVPSEGGARGPRPLVDPSLIRAALADMTTADVLDRLSSAGVRVLPVTIESWRYGRHAPQRRFHPAIVAALGVSADALFVARQEPA